MPGEFEALFVEHLPTIRRIAGAIARRNGLYGDDIEEWISWLSLRCVADDYRVLRNFRGESSLGTYLTVVIALKYRDYRIHRWGRWRPSAAARRKGEVAVQLETLVWRDGFTLEHAAEMLRTRGLTTLTDRELADLLAGLPQRTPLRPLEVGPDPLDEVEGDPGPDEHLVAEEAAAETRRAERASLDALSTLAPEDQVIVRLRYLEGLSVADVARALGLEPKSLYRRIERVLAELRRQVEARGISREEVRDAFGDARI